MHSRSRAASDHGLRPSQRQSGNVSARKAEVGEEAALAELRAVHPQNSLDPYQRNDLQIDDLDI